MRDPDDPPLLPDRPEVVTPEWLTGALAATAPGARVSTIEVLDQHTGTTGRLRLRLAYAPGPTGPDSVFVKLPPFDETQRKLVAATDMGRREARFYAGPGAEAPLRIPQAYFTACGEQPTEYVMVLEDLVASGCRFATRDDPLVADGGDEIVAGLARLHAHFWDDPRFDGELGWVRPAMRGPYGAKLVDRAREQLGDRMPPVFTELCRLYVDHHERICELWDAGEQTLIHGDTHAGNQFRSPEGMGIYDWAVVSRSPGVRDVAIYLGNSCPTELRREREDGWLRAYRDVLVAEGVDAPGFDDLWLRYRQSVLYAWVAATTTAAMGSRWQPIEVGIEGTTRATRTCADLDTVEAIRSSL